MRREEKIELLSEIEDIHRKREHLSNKYLEQLGKLDSRLNRLLNIVRNQEKAPEFTQVQEKRYQNIRSDVLPIIVGILKKNKGSILSRELFRELEEEYQLTYKNHTTIMKHIMRYEPRIVKVSRGVYELKEN